MTGPLWFFGTPLFAARVLEALVKKDFSLTLIVTQPDRPAGRGYEARIPPVKALARGLVVSVFQPASLKEPSAREYFESLARVEPPQAAVVAAYGQILPAWLLEMPARGFYNVHASLLPRWRGASPIEHAIWAGDAVTGVSIMRVVQKLDAGPLYCSKEIPIGASMDAPALEKALAQAGAAMLAENLDAILGGRIPATPQDESSVSYAPKLGKEHGALDWRRAAAELERQVRALRPWPGTFTHLRGKKLKVLRARAASGTGSPGAVLEARNALAVACGTDALVLEEVQLEGKKAMSAADFLRGTALQAGESLPLPDKPNPAPA